MDSILEQKVKEHWNSFILYVQRESNNISQRLATRGLRNSGAYITEFQSAYSKCLSGFEDIYGQQRPGIPELYKNYYQSFPGELSDEVIQQTITAISDLGTKVGQNPPFSSFDPSPQAIKTLWQNFTLGLFSQIVQGTRVSLAEIFKKQKNESESVSKGKKENKFSRLNEIAALPEAGSNQGLKKILDNEVVENGIAQGEVYSILFLIENSLRRYIDQNLSSKLGVDYFDKIQISSEIRKGIAARKSQESANAWIRSRGDSDLYYLDFIELNYVIKNNWEHFKMHLPSQEWMGVKIDELYKCRCLVAHNSLLGSHEIDVVVTNGKSILLQLSSKL